MNISSFDWQIKYNGSTIIIEMKKLQWLLERNFKFFWLDKFNFAIDEIEIVKEYEKSLMLKLKIDCYDIEKDYTINVFYPKKFLNISVEKHANFGFEDLRN